MHTALQQSCCTVFYHFRLSVAWHHLQTLVIAVAPANPSNLSCLVKAKNMDKAILILRNVGPLSCCFKPVNTHTKLPSPKFRLRAPGNNLPWQPVVAEPLSSGWSTRLVHNIRVTQRMNSSSYLGYFITSLAGESHNPYLKIQEKVWKKLICKEFNTQNQW